MKCDWHGISHQGNSLTAVRPDYTNGDPEPQLPGWPLMLCARAVKERERQHRQLDKQRKQYSRGKEN